MKAHSPSRKVLRLAVRYRVFAVAALLLILGLALGQRAWAIDRPDDLGSQEVELRQTPNGTVPPPPPPKETPTREPTPRNDDNGNGGGGSLPPATPVPPPAPTTPRTPSYAGVISALALNVRQGPGTNYPILGKLRQGAQVLVTGRNAAGNWWFVCCLPGTRTSGWVSAQFVTPSFTPAQASRLPVIAAATPPAATPIPTQQPPSANALTGVVTAVTLNMRGGPGITFPVVGKLPNGAIVVVLGANRAGSWYYVCCIPGTQANGWISAEFLTPNFTAAEAATLALYNDDGTALSPATPASAEAVTAATDDATATEELPPTTLTLSAAQEPPFVGPGDRLALLFSLANTGNEEAAEVTFSYEVPEGMTLADAAAEGEGDLVLEPGNNGAPAIVVTWPALAASQRVTVTVTLDTDATLAKGTVLENLAAATAANADSAATSISVGMPPAAPPDFQ